MKKTAVLAFLILIAALVIACGSHRPGAMAMATLQATSTTGPSGTVHFTDQGDGGTEVQVDITGLDPHSVHGFHIHENPSCADMGNAAGGHFNPTSMPHAAPTAVSHHAGDFGNVAADDKGEVHEKFVTHSVTAHAGEISVLGHAVVLHEKADDLTTQPSGNAGKRIACGVVEAMAGTMHH